MVLGWFVWSVWFGLVCDLCEKTLCQIFLQIFCARRSYSDTASSHDSRFTVHDAQFTIRSALQKLTTYLHEFPLAAAAALFVPIVSVVHARSPLQYQEVLLCAAVRMVSEASRSHPQKFDDALLAGRPY